MLKMAQSVRGETNDEINANSYEITESLEYFGLIPQIITRDRVISDENNQASLLWRRLQFLEDCGQEFCNKSPYIPFHRRV